MPTDKIGLIDTGVLLMMSNVGLTEEQMKEDPLVSALEVAKNNRVVYIERDLGQLFSASSPISIPIALEKLKGKLSAAAQNAPRE